MNYKEKLNRVTTIILDVDGVLTDGRILITVDLVKRASLIVYCTSLLGIWTEVVGIADAVTIGINLA